MEQNINKEFIYQLLSKYSNIKLEQINDDMILGKDLIIDSIEVGEIFMILKQHNPNINQHKLFTIKTVSDLINVSLS